MKTSKTLVAVALALAGLTAAGSALAQHRHHHGPRLSIGFGFGVPYYGGYPYYPYYPPYAYRSYYPGPVVIQQQEPVYIEQNAPPAAAPQSQNPSNYWYYCDSSRAYYPHVKECSTGWQRVTPQPG